MEKGIILGINNLLTVKTYSMECFAYDSLVFKTYGSHVRIIKGVESDPGLPESLFEINDIGRKSSRIVNSYFLRFSNIYYQKAIYLEHIYL